MTILRIVTLFMLSLAVDIAGWFLVPVGLLFCGRDAQRLPRLFWPWDNDIEGINGDIYWRTDPAHHPDDYWRFWPRYVWLAWRNPSNNFITFVLGYTPDATTAWTESGDPLTEDQPNGHSGSYELNALHRGRRYPMFYLVRRYPFWPSKCFRLYVGWKNKGHQLAPTAFVCTLNPIANFRSP